MHNQNTELCAHSTGKERDAESGLDYFGARYYGSSMGRWISADWAQKPEAVPYSKLDDPQSLNLYEYVKNNPLAKPDLDDHGCPPDCPVNSVGALGTLGMVPVGTVAKYGPGSIKLGIGVGLIASAAVGDEPGAVSGLGITLTALKTLTGWEELPRRQMALLTLLVRPQIPIQRKRKKW